MLSKLGEMEVARIAMHPGSVRGFGQLGREGVPTFLLPANPVSALVVFEVMVRPLIRLSLGKRQPMRQVVQARALSPILVPAITSYREQLMQETRTRRYLNFGAGRAQAQSSPLAATLAEGRLPGSELPAEVDPSAHREDRRRRLRCSAADDPRECGGTAPFILVGRARWSPAARVAAA